MTKKERNNELVRRVKLGDKDAERCLIEENLGFIKYILNRSAHEDTELYLCDAYLAVIRSAHAFDETKGLSFLTLAGHAIFNAYRTQRRDEMGKVQEKIKLSELFVDGNRYSHKWEPTQLGVTYPDIIANSEEYELLLAEFRKNLQHLSELERDVLLCRAKGVTLREAGDRFGISKERIRQIQNYALQKLRDRCAEIFTRLGLPDPPTKTSNIFRV